MGEGAGFRMGCCGRKNDFSPLHGLLLASKFAVEKSVTIGRTDALLFSSAIVLHRQELSE